MDAISSQPLTFLNCRTKPVSLWFKIAPQKGNKERESETGSHEGSRAQSFTSSSHLAFPQRHGWTLAHLQPPAGRAANIGTKATNHLIRVTQGAEGH